MFGLFGYIDLVHIEGIRGLDCHALPLLHVPFHVKDIFRVGVGGVLVVGVLRQVVCYYVYNDFDVQKNEQGGLAE